MYIGVSGGFDDLVHLDGPGVVTVRDIFCDTRVEQHRLLGNDAHLGS